MERVWRIPFEPVFKKRLEMMSECTRPRGKGDWYYAGSYLDGPLFTVDAILGHMGKGMEGNYRSLIAALNPAVLDLGCGAEDVQWMPHVPLMLSLFGADPERIVGVDLAPFKYSEGRYTHLQGDLVPLVREGRLAEFLAANTPRGGFDAVVYNNVSAPIASSELMAAIRKAGWREGEFVRGLYEQARELLGPDSVIVNDYKIVYKKTDDTQSS